MILKLITGEKDDSRSAETSGGQCAIANIGLKRQLQRTDKVKVFLVGGVTGPNDGDIRIGDVAEKSGGIRNIAECGRCPP